MAPAPYVPRRVASERLVEVRGLRQRLLVWPGEATTGAPAAGDRAATEPPLVMLHGWMDVAASFQFVVDALDPRRTIYALDWRGFGGSDTPAADTYYFSEYLGDLELVLDALFGLDRAPLDLLGHSMGGNVAMLYAGVRPECVRRLVNLEGFGMPRTQPAQAPGRMARWLDELKAPQQLRGYANVAEVAARLRKTNPLLREDRAAWLAGEWSRPLTADQPAGARLLAADPNHKRMSPIQPQVDEWLACYRCITAPLLWIEGDRTDLSLWWGDRYGKAEFHQRLDSVTAPVERHVVGPAGHMLHHDRPEDVARLVDAFLSESRPS